MRVEERGGELGIADVTFWEIAQMLADERIRIADPLPAWLQEKMNQTKTTPVRLTPAIADIAARISMPGCDSFDRIIAATAKWLGVPLVTADGPIHDSGVVETIW